MLEIFPRTPSYPLAEALRRFGDANLVSWLEENEDSDDPEVRDLCWTRQRELVQSILPDLRSGALVATAFQEPFSISSERKRISADIWKLLTFKVENGSASFRGLSIFDIEVQEDEWLGRMFGIRAKRKQALVSNPELTTQLVSAVEVMLSEDLEYLTVGDNQWRLTGDIQQHIIKQLVDAFPAGKPLKTAKVLAQAGSNSDTIAKAFNGSPNWPTLSPYIKIGGGTCQLVTSPSAGADPENGSEAPEAQS